jgi:hypothetical protein
LQDNSSQSAILASIVNDCVVTCPVCKTQVQEHMVSETLKLIYHCPKCLTWLSPKKGDHAPAPLSNVTVTATLSHNVSASLTVMSFKGVDATGTNGSGAIGATGSGNSGQGAPTASLVTTRNGSWVLGVGNDYDNAISRTPGAGQVLVHQYLAPVGDTYWVQRQNTATAASGTTGSINDTAPTTDRYNLTICEVLPSASSSAGG